MTTTKPDDSAAADFEHATKRAIEAFLKTLHDRKVDFRTLQNLTRWKSSSTSDITIRARNGEQVNLTVVFDVTFLSADLS